MKHLEKLARKRLSEILVDEGLISKSQLADAEREQKQTGEPLGFILVDSRYIVDADLARVVASQYQLPYVCLSVFPRNKELEGLFEPEELRSRKFLPLDRIGRTFTMAVSEMPDIEFLKEMSERLQATPFLFVTQLDELRGVLEGGNGTASPTRTPDSKPGPVPARSKIDEEDLNLAEHAETAPEIVEGLAVFDHSPSEGTNGDDRRPTEPEPEPEEELEVPVSGEDWENLFDSADAAVKSDLERD